MSDHGPTETTHRNPPPAEVVKEANAESAAEQAVEAYETASDTALDELALAESLKSIADSLTTLVHDALFRTGLKNRISKRAELIAAKRAKFEADTLTRAVMKLMRTAEVVPFHRLAIKTYDGSGQSVHPDVLCFDKLWSGYKCWMVLTPYANANLENPSLYVSQDGKDWEPAPGVHAPLVPALGYGYNSDPELVFDKSHGCLQIVYREVIFDNAIKMLESCDGVAWTQPKLLFALPSHQAISPSVMEGPDGKKRIIYVDAGAYGCGAKSTRLMVHLVTDGLFLSDTTGSEMLNVAQPGYIIWHAKGRFVPEVGEYWVLFAAFPTTGYGCAQNDLFLAKSKDLKDWKVYPVPLLGRLETRFDFASLYRATFLYDASKDELQIITSALEQVDGWQEFTVTYDYSKLTRILDHVAAMPEQKLVSIHTSLMNRVPVMNPKFGWDIWP